MSRILSLFLFVGAMYWSWTVTRTPSAVTESLHVELQDVVRKVISDYVSENSPGSSDVTFDSFWTEAMSPSKVKASFRYSFVDQGTEAGEARTAIAGFMILNRSSEAKTEQEWSIDDLVIENTSVEYRDGMNVSPGEPEPTKPAQAD